MKQQSVMKHQFSQVPAAEIPRSSFDRSHGLKTTLDAGYLYPILVDEALPGDTFSCRMTGFARLATPIHPIMDNLFMETFFFAVPNRLVWDNWQKFMGEQTNPGDSIDYTVPVTSGATIAGSIEDYFGIPPAGAPGTRNCLVHRAYNLIYNEWFRDQNMQNSVPVPTDDGPDTLADYKLLRRGKRHDYFTSALPWPQKGTAVELPLGTAADIHSKVGQNANYSIYSDPDSSWRFSEDSGAGGINRIRPTADALQDGSQSLYADLSTATASTINELRQAFQIQKLQERDARGGTRYTEIIRAHFGVVSPDARLQRPEFLGGGSTPVQITQVPQTSETTTGTPLGNLASYGTATLSGHGFTKSFTEHCIIIGLVNVRADLTYQKGLDRMWSRQTRYDFYWPALSHIGEQAILNKEIFLGAGATDENVFGYQERYAEYRYKPSVITGKFRSVAAGTLDPWHLSQDFSSTPILGDLFIEDNPPIDRVVAVVDEPHFLFDAYFKMKCARPMPLYGVPGYIDHF